MSRPLSTASSGTIPSTPSGTALQHQRHGSAVKSGGLQVPSSNTISLFLTNLRLLDLDLNQDWPNITTSSFFDLDARTRLRCTEYTLYQLFRLYEPATTAEKLQPFFPPLEPLQSVNLRAALFRCLNELKKNGVLAKDVSLRKTMLDECQGERFWELCLSFSTVVLRKRNQVRRKSSRGRSKAGVCYAEGLATQLSVSRTSRESLLPLAIAHKAALARVLEEKQRKKEKYGQLHAVLLEKEDELVRRKSKAEETSKAAGVPHPKNLKEVEAIVAKNWIGSTDLRDALISGDTCAKGDVLLLASFDYVWDGGSSPAAKQDIDSAEGGLLQSLNDQAAQQSARLRRWQHFHDRLLASKPTAIRASRPPSQVQPTGIAFNRHQDINLHSSPADNDEPEEDRPAQRVHQGTLRYDEILSAMREELRQTSRTHRTKSIVPSSRQFISPMKRVQTQPATPLRKLSVATDVTAGAQSLHARSPSHTTVPLRSPMGRRVSSRSRSYDKPKVDGQREPIPLKSEMFSPLKENRRSSMSPLFGGHMLPSPAEASEPTERHDTNQDHSKDLRGSAEGGDEMENELRSPPSPRDSGLGLDEGTVKDAKADQLYGSGVLDPEEKKKKSIFIHENIDHSINAS